MTDGRRTIRPAGCEKSPVAATDGAGKRPFSAEQWGHPASFRDPSGAIFTVDGTLYRGVSAAFLPVFRRFVDEGLCGELQAAGLLIPHVELEPAVARQVAEGQWGSVLRPERIAFVSYPYEWGFLQLRDAALLTLDLQRRAVQRGFSLKDASAFNVQFRQGRPVFIDTLSFEPWQSGQPWVAYRQFCSHFLAPLAATAYSGHPIQRYLQVHLDGLPLDLASHWLPWRTWLRPGLLTHLHLHALGQRWWSVHSPACPASSAPGTADGANRRQGGFSAAAMLGLVDSLQSAIAGLQPPRSSHWADYYETCTYSDAATRFKERFVSEVVERFRPGLVWDLGANTGRYARLAAAGGARVVALDADPASIDALYRDLTAGTAGASTDAGEILPLLVDLANPSPAIGWNWQERDALLDRPRPDLVLALALVHHLAIGNNLPLSRIAGWLARLTPRVVLEFVPKTDVQVQRLLACRADVFPNYTEQGMLDAFAGAFELVERRPVPESERTLAVFARRPA